MKGLFSPRRMAATSMVAGATGAVALGVAVILGDLPLVPAIGFAAAVAAVGLLVGASALVSRRVGRVLRDDIRKLQDDIRMLHDGVRVSGGTLAGIASQVESLDERLSGLGQSTAETRTAVMNLRTSDLPGLRREVEALRVSDTPMVVRRIDQLISDLGDVRRRVYDVEHQLPGVVEQMAGLLWLSLDEADRRPLLGTRGWAASPDALAWLVYEARRQSAELVLDIGSGWSTLVLAREVSRWGGRVLALEHDQSYAERTVDLLEAEGLGEVAAVAVAPLTETNAGRWFDPTPLGAAVFDLVFVDGPPTDSEHPDARRPALPLLIDRHLRPGSVLLLDDADRDEEASVIESWEAAFPDRIEVRRLPAEKGLARLMIKS